MISEKLLCYIIQCFKKNHKYFIFFVFLFSPLSLISINHDKVENARIKYDNNNSPTIYQVGVFPNLPYDYQTLLEIVNEIPINSEIKNKAIIYLDNINKKIFEIRRYQSKTHVENFYHSMQAAIYEIHNITKSLYELTNPYHNTLPNSLKELILQWITPLEKELEKRLEMSGSDREELTLKTKRLYAEQSLISRKALLQKSLMEHLDRLRNLLTEQGSPSPRCYISYAWPSKENKEKEYWVQPFLSVLYDHLTAAGIRVVMDIRDNKPGDSIYQFMKQYHQGNYIILIGTDSLLQKHYSTPPHAVQTELSIISDRFEQDQKQFGCSRIYPLLISGTIKTAYPEIYNKYRTVRDGRELGYILMLQRLIDWIYERRISGMKEEYVSSWKAFNKSFLGLSKEANGQMIEQELNIGYHRQNLDYLKQDLQFQTVQAQEQTKHSPAVAAEIIGALMRSQGKEPKLLYDEYGQQFQRPSITPDFIERQKLWKKIVTHFNQSECQILTLTAHGLGGVGKTELAKYYYLHPPRPYALRVWFNAESKEQLYSQYVDLAKANGIEFLKETPVQEQAKKVKNWLELQKDCLLVYDNASSAKQMEGLFPERGKHHILITSRNEVDWPDHQKLDVDLMEEHEAVALIRKITGFQGNEKKLKELVKTLGYLPLALAQAGAYMAQKRTSIEDYLGLYRKYRSLIMSDGTLVSSHKHEPVWVTFNMNFKALEADCPIALKTLKQVSWLDASAIPSILLKIMVKNNDKPLELLWGDVKENILRYSLMRIDREGRQLSMHRLLQDILRSKQNESERKNILNHISLSIKAIYPENNKTMEDIALVKLLLPHVATATSHAKGFLNKIEYANFNLESILGDAYDTTGNFIKAKENFSSELAINKKKYGSDHIEVANILYRIGKIDIELGNYENSKKLLEKSLIIKEIKLGNNHIEVSKILDKLGWLYLYLADFVGAKPLLERALFIKKQRCPNGIEMANTLVNLGWNYNLLGSCAKAEPLVKLALKIYENHFGYDHIETAKALNALGKTYFYLGKYNKAKEFSERALALRKTYYGMEHILTANTLISFGWVNLFLGDYQKAKESFEHGLSVFEKNYGNSHQETAYAINNLGVCYSHLGYIDKAKKLHERALEIYKDELPHEHILVINTLNNLGISFLNLGKPTESKNIFEEILDIITKQYGAQHIFTATVMANLGNAHRLLGNYSQSKKLLESALKFFENHYNYDAVDTARIMGTLALLYGELNNYDKKKEYLKKAMDIFNKNLYKTHFDIIKTSKELEKMNDANSRIGKIIPSKSKGYPIIFLFY
jgi:tetratricopeptide (TPR) repeat protein